MPTKQGQRKVTASLIAKEAGVSPATVSLVLNRRGDDLRINRQTQQRVFDAARRLNYVPNYLARGLTGASTKSIGLIWPLGGSPTNAAIAAQLVQSLAKRGYVTNMTDHLRSSEFTLRTLKDMQQRKVDGLILSSGGNILDSSEVRDALKAFQHVVLVSPKPVQIEHDLILHDRQQAMRDAVDHLVATGRKRIGVLTVGHANELKITAVREQLTHLKKPTDDLMIIEDIDTDLDDFMPRMVQLIDRKIMRGFDYDAVLCTDDELAFVLIQSLMKHDIRIPRDVAVVGFNDVNLCSYLTPKLASVRRRDLDVAMLAEKMLFERFKTPDLSPRIKHVMMQFTCRESAERKGA